MSEAEALRRIEELTLQLADAEQALVAMAAGQVDAVASADGLNHLLLHDAQEALRSNERLMRGIFHGAVDAIVLMDGSGALVHMNPAACELFGQSQAELLGKPLGSLFSSPALFDASFAELLKLEGLRGELSLVRKGVIRHVEYCATANVLPGLDLALLRDVTEQRQTQETLRRAEEQLRTVVASAPLVLGAVNAEGVCILAEGKGLERLSIQPEDLIGTFVYRLFPEGDAYLQRVLAGEVVRYEHHYQDAVFNAIVSPMRNPDGEVIGAINVSVDVTERAAAEAAQGRSEARFRGVIENSSEVVALAAEDGALLYVSPSSLRVLGHDPASLVGSALAELVLEQDRSLLLDALAQLRRQPAERITLELRCTAGDGSMRWVEAAFSNQLASEAVSAIVGNLRDISDRKRAERDLGDQHAFMAEAQAIAQMGIWAAPFDVDAPAFWSDETYRVLGVRDTRPATARLFLDRVHPEDRARLGQALEGAWQTGTVYELEHRIVWPSGEVRWVYQRASVQDYGEGDERRLVGFIQDITARRSSLEQVRLAEEKYRRIVETTSEGVWTIDAESKTTFVNARMAEMLGYTRSEMLGESVLAFIDEATAAQMELKLAHRRQGLAENHESAYRRKDGSVLWALVKTNPMFGSDGAYEGAIALFTDISERWRSEAARNQLAALVESSQDAIKGTDLKGVITSWNRGAEQLYGYTAEEAIGRTVDFLLPLDRLDEEQQMLNCIVQGEAVPPRETVRRRKDGSLVEVSLVASAIRDAKGNTVGASRIARDLTERRKAEALLRRTEEQLRQSHKMEAVGSLAGGVAHDFNNLLSVILNFSEFALDTLAPDSSARADIEQVMIAAQKAGSLTRQLLTFSRQQILAPQVVAVEQRVSGLQIMLARLLGEHIQLRMAAAPGLGRVYGDPGQIDQVIINLCLNARDAMPDGGVLAVETSNVRLGADYVAEHPEVRAGDYVLLSVSDAGTGIDPAIVERIFEPFFSTKEQGRGTGLGLSTVFGIVKQSGGHITVITELGQGTTFNVYLPQSDRPVEPLAPPSRAPSSLVGTETILVVEDDAALRAAVRSALRRHGYKVLEAQNGVEALSVCEQTDTAIDLLLTDVVMPRMGGRELVAQLPANRADLKVLYMSGYAENTVVTHGMLDAGIAYLSKPITPGALSRKVREVLDAPSVRLRPG